MSIELHRQAERFLSKAELARRYGHNKRARMFYTKAASYEEGALNDIKPDKPRTMGITAVSAATLYLRGRNYEDVKRTATDYLGRQDIPEFARKELRRVLNAAKARKH